MISGYQTPISYRSQRETTRGSPFRRFVDICCAVGHASLVIGICVLAEPARSSSDWPMFQYNLLHTGYNDRDSITVPLEVRWHIRYQLGFPLDQLSVVGNRLYMTSEETHPYQEPDPVVRCVDATTGRGIWHRYWQAYECDEISGIAYDNGRVYFEVFYGNLSTFWTCNAESGEPLWVDLFPMQFADYFSPVPYKGRVLGFGGYYCGVFSWDVATGRKQHYFGLSQGIDEFTVAVHQDTIYSFVAGLIRAHDVNTGEKLWSVSTLILKDAESGLSGMGTAPVIDTVRHILYAVWQGHFDALDLTTRTFLWHRPGKYNSLDRAVNPTIYEDKVIISDSGIVKAYNCYSGEEQWRVACDSAVTYHMAGANGLIFASSDGKTTAIDAERGEIVWECDVGGNLSIANNCLYIATIDGEVYVYGSPPTDFEDPDEPALPEGYALFQNQPNPFNPSTEISFSVPVSGRVRIEIVNSLGQVVAMVADRRFSVGTHMVNWDGSGCASGVYLCRMTAGTFIETKKMVLVM